MTTVGIIGGSGFYDIESLTDRAFQYVETPFGVPSDVFEVGRVGDVKVVMLPRHGRGHTIPPHKINYRANIYAMKKLGVEWLVSVSAVGSLHSGIEPGDLVLVNDFVDKTRYRQSTFFDDIAVHVSFADPVSGKLHAYLERAVGSLYPSLWSRSKERRGAQCFSRGTYVVMEGPPFSTRAESSINQQIGSVIGMTAMPEAKLAREAEISYATLAFVTDYDAGVGGHEAVTADQVASVSKQNTLLAKEVLSEFLKHASDLDQGKECPARSALKGAIMTNLSCVPEVTRISLLPLIEKYTRLTD